MTNKSQHTPGPWESQERDILWWPVRAEGEHVFVARSYQSEADARLIAAAPEMLDAHNENIRLLKLLIHDLQGRVEGGKLSALITILDRSQDVVKKATDQ